MMLGRIVYCNNVSVEPWSRVRPRKGPAQSDGHVAVDFVDDFVVAVVDNVHFALFLFFPLLLSLLSSFSWLFTVI